jgi:hypothetical protein
MHLLSTLLAEAPWGGLRNPVALLVWSTQQMVAAVAVVTPLRVDARSWVVDVLRFGPKTAKR